MKPKSPTANRQLPTDNYPILPPISTAAPGTLYQQVIDGIKREIAEGRLRPGAALPSFRALANEVMVSVITVKRAYEELEREGIIYRKQGLGTFVTERGDERTRQARLRRAQERLRDAVKEALEAGMDAGDVVESMAALVEELADSSAMVHADGGS